MVQLEKQESHCLHVHIRKKFPLTKDESLLDLKWRMKYFKLMTNLTYSKTHCIKTFLYNLYIVVLCTQV